MVLHVDKARAAGWTDLEVAERWLQLYKAPVLVERWLAEPAALGAPELKVVTDIIGQWRERLYDLSWFMRGVNETVARMANAEDNVKGRFWEGRFKSQALLDETALLSCMAYVDLNPIRAGIEDDLVNSDFTSIQQRLFDYVKRKPIKNEVEKTVIRRVNDQRELEADMKLDKLPAAPLMPFDGSSHTHVHVALPFTREDYFDLVDATGRIMREDKKGFIPSEVPSVLLRFSIQPHKWLDHVKNFSRRYGQCAGSVARMQDYAAVFDKRWCKGVGVSQRLAA